MYIRKNIIDNVGRDSMGKIWECIVVCFIFGVGYFLYRNGFIGLKFTRAMSYVGMIGNSYKDYHKASVVGCSGCIKRVLKFKDNRTYTFTLKAMVSKGDLYITLLDANKNVLLELTQETPQACITVHPKERYYLVIKYIKTDGKYELNWE